MILINNKYWESLKTVCTICYILGTIMLLSPKIAAEAITPWSIFLVGNSIQFTNYILQRNIQFMVLSIFFFIWDTLIIISRLTGTKYLDVFIPLLTILENNIK